MKRSVFLQTFSGLAVGSLVTGIGAAEAAGGKSPVWNSMEFAPIPLFGPDKGPLRAVLQSNADKAPSSLELVISWGGVSGVELPEMIADATQFKVLLHLQDGRPIAPKDTGKPREWDWAQSRGRTYSLSYDFPWQRNAMDEAWIELAFAGRRYWFELPYGFARNPADQLATDGKRGDPVFPPAMRQLSENEHLVPWLCVWYEFGIIQNNWRLTLAMANPFDASAELILYRDDSEIGKSMFLWGLHTPLTGITIETASREQLTSLAMAVRLHDDGMHRSDDFNFNRYPERGRDWGKAVIKVDDRTWYCMIPSSLFKYTHGFTGDGHSKYLPRPPKVLESRRG